MTWTEIADGVLHRRYEPFDVTVGVVRGSDGLLVVDTRSSAREAQRLVEDLARFGAPVVGIVLTHAHFDHAFGTHRLLRSTGPVPVWGHRDLSAHLDRYERPDLARWVRDGSGPVPHLDEVVLVDPDHVVATTVDVDLGDRGVRLWHPGRGHTDHDLLVGVPDVGCWFAGDLVEESGPPSVAEDSDLLAWPDTLETLLGSVDAGVVVVPGHGAPVDRAFVAGQQARLRAAVAALRAAVAAGESLDDAAAAVTAAADLDLRGVRAAVEVAYPRVAGRPAAQDVGTSST